MNTRPASKWTITISQQKPPLYCIMAEIVFPYIKSCPLNFHTPHVPIKITIV